MNKQGEVTEQYDINTLLISIIYNVEFADGEIKEYAANLIAQNKYAVMAHGGRCMRVLESIIDHKIHCSNQRSTSLPKQ